MNWSDKDTIAIKHAAASSSIFAMSLPTFGADFWSVCHQLNARCECRRQMLVMTYLEFLNRLQLTCHVCLRYVAF